MTANLGPRLSIKRPTNGKAKDPKSVPKVYISETRVRDKPRSLIRLSKKTDTPTVCPGCVIMMPKVPASKIIQP